jgi:hypothetical protein
MVYDLELADRICTVEQAEQALTERHSLAGSPS